MRKEEVVAKSIKIQVTLLQWQWSSARNFCGTCKRTENRRTCCDRRRSTVRNDENRPSLITSSAVAEQRQGVSSKNTTDEMADAITAGNDIGLWPANIPEKIREYWLKYGTDSFWHCDEKSFLKHDVPQHRKNRSLSRKCTTSLIRRQNHNSEVVHRSWLCFAPSQTCVKCLTCRLMCADTTNVRISSLEKEFSTGSTLLSAWGATNIQWTYRCYDYISSQM